MLKYCRLLVLFAASLFFVTGAVRADDAKTEAKTKAKAKAKAKLKEERLKARLEAEAKAKAEAAAKEKAEAEAKAKAAAAEKTKREADEKAAKDAEAKAKVDAAERAKALLPRVDSAPLTRKIDAALGQKLAAEKIAASPRADDAEFVRRIYLDLMGVIPPADKAAAFIDDNSANKRARLIDELLTSPAFGKHLADIWDNLLFQRITDNRAVRVEPLSNWLERQFNDGQSWDKLAGQLLTATGSQEENGASTYMMGQLSADKITDSVSRLFLGVKIECAQCHNHPFVDYKQNDYWSLAAFFMKVRVQGNTRNAKNGPAPGLTEVSGNAGRQRGLPESAKQLPPKFLKGDAPKVASNQPLRPEFVKWLTSANNSYFGKAWANRVWGQLFGAGIINPIDDMHDERVPSHPELLKELGTQFVASGFDVRYLYRAICNSEAYQRTSKPVAGNESDRTFFSHMYIKAMTPEQLYDSLTAVVGAPQAARNAPRANAAPRGPQGPREQFVAFFDPGEGVKATDYEAGIPQALRLMNAPQVTRNSAQVARTIVKDLSQEKAIEKLYLTTLARRPTTAEAAKMKAYIAKTTTQDGYGDILWALLNSAEFALNH